MVDMVTVIVSNISKKNQAQRGDQLSKKEFAEIKEPVQSEEARNAPPALTPPRCWRFSTFCELLKEQVEMLKY